MSEKKKKDSPSKNSLQQAKDKRKLAWEAKQEKKGNDQKQEREEFRKFFVKIKGKLKLDKSMEEVIWLHLKASGFNKKEDFEKGIKHFGYSL
jgi:hypothetical protein